jgi:hypothetical protein
MVAQKKTDFQGNNYLQLSTITIYNHLQLPYNRYTINGWAQAFRVTGAFMGLVPLPAPNTPRPACGPSARPCPPRSARRAAPVLRAFLLLSPPLSSLSLSSHPSPLDPNYPFCPLSPLARWSALAPDSARSRRRTFCRIHLGDSSIAKTTASGPPRRGGPLAGVLLQAPSGPGRHGTSARRGWSFTGCLAC